MFRHMANEEITREISISKERYSDLALQQKSVRYRIALLKSIKMAKAGHTGGDLSCVEILNVLYNDVMNVSPENLLNVVFSRNQILIPWENTGPRI